MTAYNDLLTGQFDQIGGLLTGQMEQLTSKGQIDELLKIKGTLWIFEFSGVLISGQLGKI